MTTSPTPDRDPNSIDLPFLEQEASPLEMADVILSGGVVVMSCVVHTPNGPAPALAFRFSDPTGEFLRPVLLVLNNVRMEGLPALVAQAAASAVAGSRAAS